MLRRTLKKKYYTLNCRQCGGYIVRKINLTNPICKRCTMDNGNLKKRWK